MTHSRLLHKIFSAVSLAILLLLTLAATSVSYAQTFTVIHTFAGGGGDGAYPSAGVTLRGGTLFGTAFVNGSSQGEVFQMVRNGENWKIIPISFLPARSLARVVFGPDGHPYGTTSTGGSSNVGILFDLIAPLSICKTAFCPWKENVLHSFTDYPSDGANPGYGDIVWDTQGNAYGTTINGGKLGLGTVYELTKSGNSYTENTIYSFSGYDGGFPQNGVIIDNNGNLLGTSPEGGGVGGNVFKLTKVGNTWIGNDVYDFLDSNEGGYPAAGLISDSAGNLYTATTRGGWLGSGTVLKLSPAGSGWSVTLLALFPGNGIDYCGPHASLSMDAAGNLYGTTLCSGANYAGNVFKLTKTQNGWVYASLHDFTGGADGARPYSTVTIDSDGTLYGTASQGGNGYGVIWMIKP